MKYVVGFIAVVMGMIGLIMLFGEVDIAEPMSSQVWLWLKGIGLIALAVLLYGIAARDEKGGM